MQKSLTECRAGGRIGRECIECCVTAKDQGEGEQISGEASTGVPVAYGQRWLIGIEEGTAK